MLKSPFDGPYIDLMFLESSCNWIGLITLSLIEMANVPNDPSINR